MVLWENRTDPKVVEDFKRAYEDQTISLTLISETFNISISGARGIAHRLGLVERPIRPTTKNKKPEVVTIHSLEEAEKGLKEQLAALQQKKAEMLVYATRTHNMVNIGGLVHGGAFTTSVEMARQWLDGGGAQKLRDVVGHRENR
jgi:hypothetical protein